MELKAGDRVEFRAHGEPDSAPLDPGTQGTVQWVGAWTTAFSERGKKHRQIGVDWDNGRSLMLIEPIDKFSPINEK